MSSKYFNTQAWNAPQNTRETRQRQRGARRGASLLCGRGEKCTKNVLLTQLQNEQHNVLCASQTNRINLAERAKMRAEGENDFLKPEDEKGRAQKIKWTWIHKHVCALKKITSNTQKNNTKRTKIIIRRASKLNAHSESALLKSEGETGSAQNRYKMQMNSQTSMRTEKNHQQHAKCKYKTNQNHIGNNTNAKTMVAALNSRLRRKLEIQIFDMTSFAVWRGSSAAPTVHCSQARCRKFRFHGIFSENTVKSKISTACLGAAAGSDPAWVDLELITRLHRRSGYTAEAEAEFWRFPPLHRRTTQTPLSAATRILVRFSWFLVRWARQEQGFQLPCPIYHLRWFFIFSSVERNQSATYESQ